MDVPSSDGIALCQIGDVAFTRDGQTPMNEVTIIGVYLAKNVFQVHGGCCGWRSDFPKETITPAVSKMYGLLAIEACATSHYWAREITKLGHEVRLIAPN